MIQFQDVMDLGILTVGENSENTLSRCLTGNEMDERAGERVGVMEKNIVIRLLT